MVSLFLDAMTPDYVGLPSPVRDGLVHLTNNGAGLLVGVSGLGIALSLMGLVFASLTGDRALAARASSGAVVSMAAVALLYLGVATVNYTARLFS